MKNVAVLLKRDDKGVSIAEIYDTPSIQRYCRHLNRKYGAHFTVVRPQDQEAAIRNGDYDAFLILGADERMRQLSLKLDSEKPYYIWAKAYNLSLDPNWVPILKRAKILFDSAHLSGAVLRMGSNVRYLPIGYHDPWPLPWKEFVERVKNVRANPRSFDVVFSGSGRMVRKDQYRQRVLNRLAEMGLRVCVTAQRIDWTSPPPQAPKHEIVRLSPDIHMLGTRGDPAFFHRAKCVLDLPWVDTVVPPHPEEPNPNATVWALSSNLFRMGAFGANVLTHDCPPIRDLGLNEQSCTFYKTGVQDVERLAEEIHDKVKAMNHAESDRRRRNIRALFLERHRFVQRWDEIYRGILQADHTRVEGPAFS